MLSLLRKAGQKIRSFDDAYATKVADYIGSFKPQTNSAGDYAQTATLMATGAPATRKYPLLEGEPHAVFDPLIQYGVPALNAGTRYGLPALGAVGVANAVDGLYNWAEQTPVFPAGDQQSYDTLSM